MWTSLSSFPPSPPSQPPSCSFHFALACSCYHNAGSRDPFKVSGVDVVCMSPLPSRVFGSINGTELLRAHCFSFASQMWTAVRNGWTARMTFSTNTWARWCLICPAVPALTLWKQLTVQSTYKTNGWARTSAGGMPVGPRNGWTSISPRPISACVRCSPWTARPWLLSTAAMMSTPSSLREARGPRHPISLAPSSLLSSTTRWTCCHGSCVKGTGADIMLCGPPITGSNVPTTPRRMNTSHNCRRPGSISTGRQKGEQDAFCPLHILLESIRKHLLLFYVNKGVSLDVSQLRVVTLCIPLVYKVVCVKPAC